MGNGFRMYPVAKTGDWGLAAKLRPNDYRNPILLRGAGTPTYLAPVSMFEVNSDRLLTSERNKGSPTQTIILQPKQLGNCMGKLHYRSYLQRPMYGVLAQ